MVSAFADGGAPLAIRVFFVVDGIDLVVEGPGFAVDGGGHLEVDGAGGVGFGESNLVGLEAVAGPGVAGGRGALEVVSVEGAVEAGEVEAVRVCDLEDEGVVAADIGAGSRERAAAGGEGGEREEGEGGGGEGEECRSSHRHVVAARVSDRMVAVV